MKTQQRSARFHLLWSRLAGLRERVQHEWNDSSPERPPMLRWWSTCLYFCVYCWRNRCWHWPTMESLNCYRRRTDHSTWFPRLSSIPSLDRPMAPRRCSPWKRNLLDMNQDSEFPRVNTESRRSSFSRGSHQIRDSLDHRSRRQGVEHRRQN